MSLLTHLTPGTLPQWLMTGLLALIAGILTAWIRGMPERARVANEREVIDNADAGVLRTEFMGLYEKNRKDYHALANDMQVLSGVQHKCQKALAEAHAENRGYREDMRTLLFLAKLLINEIKRLDPNPHNSVIEQAEMTLFQLQKKHDPTWSDLVKSPQRQAAEGAVISAELTLNAAEHTVEEIDAEEASK